MNDCYWGGDDDRFYYECDTGRIIGEVKESSITGATEAYYFDAWNIPRLGRYIDADRARKSIEESRRQDVEKWERMRKTWNTPAPVEEDETPRKTWWKVWQ